MPKPMMLAIPLYSRDDFKAIVRLLPDSDWPASYDAWLAKTEDGYKIVAEAGNIPCRVDVEPAAFEAWCYSNKRPLSKESIMEYCLSVLAERVSGRHN